MRFVSLGLCFALVSVNLALMRFGVRATTMSKNGFSSSAQSVRGSDVLVKFRDNASENDKNNVALLHGTIRGKKLKGQSGIEKFQVPVGQSPEAFASLLQAEPAVEFAEPNFVIVHDQFQTGKRGVTPALTSPLLNPISANSFRPELKMPQANNNLLYPGLNKAALPLKPQSDGGPNDSRFSEQWALRNT